MPTRNAAIAITIASVSAAIIAAATALARRLRAKGAALAWRAGFGTGRAWSVIRGLGTRHRGDVERDDGQRSALVHDGLGAQACLEPVLEAPPPGDPQLGEQRNGDLA
jgi:hypothetical protein